MDNNVQLDILLQLSYTVNRLAYVVGELVKKDLDIQDEMQNVSNNLECINDIFREHNL